MMSNLAARAVKMANKTVNYFVTIIQGSNNLKRKEKEILMGRIAGKTLEQIGRKFKVTAERIRQKEEAALSKLIKKFSQMLLFEKE